MKFIIFVFLESHEKEVVQDKLPNVVGLASYVNGCRIYWGSNSKEKFQTTTNSEFSYTLQISRNTLRFK